MYHIQNRNHAKILDCVLRLASQIEIHNLVIKVTLSILLNELWPNIRDNFNTNIPSTQYLASVPLREPSVKWRGCALVFGRHILDGHIFYCNCGRCLRVIEIPDKKDHADQQDKPTPYRLLCRPWRMQNALEFDALFILVHFAFRIVIIRLKAESPDRGFMQ